MAVGTITPVVAGPHGLKRHPVNLGALSVTVTTVVGPASYTSGGDALTFANLRMSNVLFAICTVAGSGSNNAAINAEYDATNQKLKFWAGTSKAEATGNLSGLTATVIAFGFGL